MTNRQTFHTFAPVRVDKRQPENGGNPVESQQQREGPLSDNNQHGTNNARQARRERQLIGPDSEANRLVFRIGRLLPQYRDDGLEGDSRMTRHGPSSRLTRLNELREIRTRLGNLFCGMESSSQRSWQGWFLCRSFFVVFTCVLSRFF